ncbi:MAG TPA: tail fiber assembly protein, partial [Pseudomonas sp.]|uniref:tail fiber assembly protein n=1 Tax=Pseudomonas sp. TaxID=306 RepID=UPI002B4703CA
GPGQYLVYGTNGMAPPPEGWGYVLNQMDAGAEVAISKAEDALVVEVKKDGEPSDLLHSITLHVSVDELPAEEIPESLPVDPLTHAQREIESRRSAADYAITPLQDAVDIDDATEEEEAQLKLWKKYRVALNRIPSQAAYPTAIDWPAPPA